MAGGSSLLFTADVTADGTIKMNSEVYRTVLSADGSSHYILMMTQNVNQK